MKSLLQLWQVMANEFAVRCRTSALRDYETVAERSNKEGVSFLTITLPQYHASFVKALDDGTLASPSLFAGFSRRGELPKFLGGFMELVFDRETGSLLDAPDLEAICAIRQLTQLYGKILLPCSEKRTNAAFERYVNVENQVTRWTEEVDDNLIHDFSRISRLIWGEQLAELDRIVRNGELIPKHGPGSTADRLSGNRKFDLRYWPERLEGVFPYLEHALPGFSYFEDLEDRLDLVDLGAELPVKVTAVPKTLKTPRIIAIEPTAMQYMQQALMEVFVRVLEEDPRGFVGILDQGPNQALAKEGSLTGTLATLDLSDASDRVSNLLVETMLCRFPHLAEAVAATRSLKASVPGQGVIPLSKFASMGSALTFPVEAMVFTAIVFMGIERSLRQPQTGELTELDLVRSTFTRKGSDGFRLSSPVVNKFSRIVRTYGDDIIVPVVFVPYVTEQLALMGSVVNQGKSFSKGNFRESCGKDYYLGEDVSTVRVRRVFPRSRLDAPECVSLVSLRNQCYMHGLWETAKWLDEMVVRVLPHFPTVSPTSPVLGRWSLLGYETQRSHSKLHSPQVKGYVAKGKPPSSNVSGIGALMKFFLKRGEEPFFDREHLERQGRPEAVDIKLRWASPF